MTHEDTYRALMKANLRLSEVRAGIAGLELERDEKLLDAEPGEIERLDQLISGLYRQEKIFCDRVKGFEQRFTQEQVGGR